MIPNSFENLHDITKFEKKHNISYTFNVGVLVGHVWVGVNPCGGCAVVALLPQSARLPQKSQNNGSKVCDLI